jgi:threonyl-tRNA synthetase
MQKKVREAETEWVNFVVVIGEREITSGVLPVRDRKLRKIRQMKLQELAEEVRKDVEGKPFLPLTLPKLLSRRPLF